MIRPYEAGDAFKLPALLECYQDSESLRAMVDSFHLGHNGQHFTLLAAGMPIACFGVFAHNHIMQLWAMASILIRTAPVAYHKAVSKTLDQMIEAYPDVTRVQSVVDVGNQAGVKQHLALGFTLEGVMKRSGVHQQDEFLFARTIDGRG